MFSVHQASGQPEIARESAPSGPPLTAGGSRFLAQKDFLDPLDYEKTLGFLGIRPSDKNWIAFWFRILLITGLLFFIAGVICFFAWNWSEMSHFQKFGLLIGFMILATAGVLWKGPDSTLGSLCLLACGLLAGPLLAVYGQYYQTGADAWELFRAWTLFLIPLAVIGRQNGLWVAAWVTGSLWIGLWIFQTYGPFWERRSLLPFRFWQYMTCQFLILVLWEGAMYQARHRQGSFLHATWPVRLIAVCLFFILTWVNMMHIGRRSYHMDDSLLGSPLFPACLHAALIFGGYYWYRFKRPDTLILTIGFLSLISLLFTWIFTAGDMFNAGGMLLAAVLLAGCAFGTAKLVMHWHAEGMKRRPGKSEGKARRSLIFLKTRTVGETFAWLGKTGAVEAEKSLAGDTAHLTPWYVRVMLTLCAWVSALFLMGFIGFTLFQVVRGSEENLLLFFGLAFLVASAFMSRASSLFVRQFALALGIAGLVAAPLGIALVLRISSWWQLPALGGALFCLLFIRHQAMRCLAFLIILFIGLDLMATFFYWSVKAFTGKDNPGALVRSFYYMRMFITTLLFAGLSALLVAAWELEGVWVRKPRLDDFFRPILFGIFVAFLIMGGLYAALGGHGYAGSPAHSFLHEVGYMYKKYSMMLAIFKWSGLGAGLGLIFLAHGVLRKGTGSAIQKAVVYLAAVALTISAWWLPWLSIGILLLALGRFLGSMPMVGVAVVFLAGCINWYYYSLRTSLLYKSYTLCAAGLMMLILGAVIYRAFKELIENPDPVEPEEARLAAAPDGGGSFVVTADMLKPGGGDHA